MTDNNEQLNIDVGAIIDNIHKKKRQNNIRTIIVCAIVFVVVVSFFAFVINDSKTGNAKDMLKQIEADCEAGDYISALSGIETFNNKYADDSKKITTRVEEIKEAIEEDAYNQLKNSTSSEDYQLFIQIYPDSKHADEINKKIPLLQAEEDIIKAKEHIDSGESEKAKELLENIIKNANVSEEQKGRAKELLDSLTIVEENDGYIRFNVARAEFIDRFNNYATNNSLVQIDESIQSTFDKREKINENASYGVENVYTYVLLDPVTSEFTREIGFMVDKEDKILQVIFAKKTSPNNKDIEELCDYGKAIYYSLLKTATENELDSVAQVLKSEGIKTNKNWGYCIRETDFGFVVDFHVIVDEKTTYSSGTQKNNGTVAKTTATDFVITGGSKNVYLISDKNYGVICPHCGHNGGAMGTWDISYELDKHYSGEREKRQNSLMCASSFQGGCRQFSNYYIMVEYK